MWIEKKTLHNSHQGEKKVKIVKAPHHLKKREAKKTTSEMLLRTLKMSTTCFIIPKNERDPNWSPHPVTEADVYLVSYKLREVRNQGMESRVSGQTH